MLFQASSFKDSLIRHYLYRIVFLWQVSFGSEATSQSLTMADDSSNDGLVIVDDAHSTFPSSQFLYSLHSFSSTLTELQYFFVELFAHLEIAYDKYIMMY